MNMKLLYIPNKYHSFLILSLYSIQVQKSYSSRAYPAGCSHESPAFYDYDSYPFPPPNIPARRHEDFALVRRLGAGKFSDVFEAVEMTRNNNENENNNDVTSNDVNTNNDHVVDRYSNDSDDGNENGIDPSTLCVIKCLKPVSERKIKRELLVLSHASQLPNLARLRSVVVPESYNKSRQNNNDETIQSSNNGNGQRSVKRNGKDQGQMPSLVLEHAGQSSRWLSHGLGCDDSRIPSNKIHTPNEAKKFNQSQQQQHQKQYQYEHPPQAQPYHLTEYEIKYYLFHLLVALDCLHSRGIMHRDVKPRNVLINRRWPPPNYDGDYLRDDDPLPLMLIDLGLADFYLPNQRYNVRVASRHYKAPELLLGNEFYDYGVDMWGVGCVLAGLLLRREPMFRGKDNVDQLGQIVAFLGKNDLMRCCDQYGIQLSPELERIVQKYTSKFNPMGTRKSWLTLLGSKSKSYGGKKHAESDMQCPIPSREGLNLVDKLLVYNHDERLTAKEAMMHPFFDVVRDKVRIEVQNRWMKDQTLH